MRFREVITVRSVFLFLCVIVGMGIGFWLLSEPKSAWTLEQQEEELQELKEEAEELQIPEQEDELTLVEATFEGVRIPIFGKKGPCVAEITAKVMTYTRATDKIVMTKPLLRRFNEDGELIMELWGDKGEVNFKAGVGAVPDLKDIRIYGNTKARHYAVKKKELTAQKGTNGSTD